MKINKKPYSKRATKRLDVSVLRDALADRRCWSCLGVVVNSEEGQHFELTTEDVLVEVMLMPSEERVTARLGSVCGGPGRGVWAIPTVGTEVAVLVPDGKLDFMPLIVATLSTSSVPSDLDETTVVISNNTGDIAVIPSSDVKLGDKAATEQAIRGNSFQTKFNNLVTAFNAHVHSGVTPGGGSSGPSTTPGVPSDASDLSTNVKVS